MDIFTHPFQEPKRTELTVKDFTELFESLHKSEQKYGYVLIQDYKGLNFYKIREELLRVFLYSLPTNEFITKTDKL